MVVDAIFNPLLQLEPVVSVTVFSVIILFLINIFYKILVDQNAAKQIKERTKELNKKMKEEQKKGNTEKMNKMMSEMLAENNKLMKLTLKPMIISFVIVLVFLPWLQTAYGDKVVTLENGDGILELGSQYRVEKAGTGGVNIGTEPVINCIGECTETIEGTLFEIREEGSKVIFAPVIAQLPVALPLVGSNAGWLGWYIMVSVPFVILLRKLMKIHV